jgi:hypothetical protein
VSYYDDLLATTPASTTAPDAFAGLLDAGTSMLTGTLGQGAGLASQLIGRLTGGDPKQEYQNAQSLQDALTYRPRTKWGKEALGLLGSTFEGAANSSAIADIADPIEHKIIKAGVNPYDLAGLTGAAGLLVGGPEESLARLKGLPKSVVTKTGERVPVMPNAAARQAAANYADEAGLLYQPRTSAAPVNPELGARTAQAFDEMEHAPNDPQVSAAYDALKNETLAQYQHMKKAGVDVELWKPDMQESPYPGGPRDAIEDIRKNNHLWVFPTSRGFGGTAEEAAQFADHPLNTLTNEVDANGAPMYGNDVFRAVHDYFGHAKEGNGFRAPGEYNAFLQHSQMYSPQARAAMASETHGQNSWVNYGPHSADNAGASETGTRYAPQKAGLLDPSLYMTPEELAAHNSQPLFDYSRLTEDPGNTAEIPRYDAPRGTPKREQRLLQNEDAYQTLLGQAKAGMTQDGVGWYNMEQLRNKFTDQLGDDAGNARFNKFMDLVAATSAGAKTDANLKIASYYLTRDAQGLPTIMPPKGSGYGHKAQNLHFSNAADILAGGDGLDPIANPKRYTFGENLKGNQDYATIDTHFMRAVGMASKDPEYITSKLADEKGAARPDFVDPADWDPKTFNPRQYVADHNVPWNQVPPQWFDSAPSKTNYLPLENGIGRRLAKDLGVTPAQAQAALWLGAGDVTGLGSKPLALLKILDGRLGVTGNARGITKQRALSELIGGKFPLLQLGGLGVGAGLLNQGSGGNDAAY